MEIFDLHYLTAAADAGKFARAAKALGVNTSTISRRIGRLEDELGVLLFERDHAGIRLTPSGLAIMVHVRRALAEIDTIKRVGNRKGLGETGEIRLGVRFSPVGEPARSLLMSWRRAHPDVTLTIMEGNERDMAMALSEHRLDVALIAGHTVWPQIVVLPLFRERIMAALPQTHALAQRETLNWALLSQETILVQGWDDSQTTREFYASVLGSGARFQVHAASKQTILALVGGGAGVTLVVQSQTEATFPGVVFKPIDEPNAWMEFDLVWPPETEDPVIGRFVAFMRDETRSQHLL